jgi:DNA-binding response OmpR family regulator
LIVEDDPGIAGSLDRGLRRVGYGTETAGTVEDALAARAYDVVLLDLGLPTATASNSAPICVRGPTPPSW